MCLIEKSWQALSQIGARILSPALQQIHQGRAFGQSLHHRGLRVKVQGGDFNATDRFAPGAAKEDRLGHGAVATVICEISALVIETAHERSVRCSAGEGKEEIGKDDVRRRGGHANL